MQVDTWTAKFKDETGTIRRIPTKETNRKVAEQILAQYEKDIARIKTGIITREELDRTQVKSMPLDDLLKQYRSKMIASSCTPQTIHDAFRKIHVLFAVCEIDSLAKIRRESVERWVANEV
jgi:integrase